MSQARWGEFRRDRRAMASNLAAPAQETGAAGEFFIHLSCRLKDGRRGRATAVAIPKAPQIRAWHGSEPGPGLRRGDEIVPGCAPNISEGRCGHCRGETRPITVK